MGALDTRSLLLIAGQLYIVMPLVVLAVLYGRHPRAQVLVWCFSGVCMGLAATLHGLRDTPLDWLLLPAANTLMYCAVLLKVPVLRAELGVAPRWGLFGSLVGMAALLFAGLFASGASVVVRVGFSGSIQSVGALWVAWLAWRLAQRIDSVGVRLIALGYGLFGALFMLRVVRVLLGMSDGLAVSPEPDFLGLLIAAMLAALGGNIGYLGMALDLARRRDADQREALVRLNDQRQALESAARTRDAVRHERYRSAQVLAHEVRQPLHNAAVVLQAALAALRSAAPVDESVRAVARAQSVLRRVTASLDNTVAAASLLTSEAQALRQEVELAVLVQLCVDDLPPDLRSRVRVEHLADVRSAALDLGLMRLALRNLLINATLYAPPDSEVLVRLLDSEQPLGLVIEVIDEGPGLPQPVAASLEAQDSNPQTTVSPTHGLGLGIVQRVMRLHGGTLAWRPQQPRGSVMRMLLPQALPD